MSDPIAPEDVARVQPPYGPLAWLLRNRDKVASGTPGKLIANDLAVVSGRGIARQWQLVAGLPVDHGTVADESAMLALHVDSSETPYPRWVVPSDSCLRADDPGWRWHCLSGHGQALSDWERRPLGGALDGLAVSGHTHTRAAISDATNAGRALMGVSTPATAKLTQVEPDGSVSLIDPPTPSAAVNVGAGVHHTSSVSVNHATLTPIQWSAEDHDDGGCADLSAQPTRLTVPEGQGGRYLVSYSLIWKSNGAGGRQAWIAKNGGTLRYAETSVPARSDGGVTSQASHAIMSLAAGDYVEIVGYQNSGGALDLYVDSVSRSCAFFRRLA